MIGPTDLLHPSFFSVFVQNKKNKLSFVSKTNKQTIYYVSETKLCHNHENPVITAKIKAIASMEIMEKI